MWAQVATFRGLPWVKAPLVNRQSFASLLGEREQAKTLSEMAVRMADVLIELQAHPLLTAQRTSLHQVEQETGLVMESERSHRVSPPRPAPPPPPHELRRPESVASSLPTVSELAAPAVLRQHPSTGQLEPPLRRVKKLRMEELVANARRMRGLSEITRSQLAEADRCIHKGRNAAAIPCLEAALLGATDEPELQCLLWRLLGNAHLSQGHYKKASVCHMHQIAFCRELDDFAGMTMAECNLGIAYLKQGLFKLSERCFLQYLENSRVLRDDMDVSYACSNLGVLEKTMALQQYHSLERGYNSEEHKEQTVEKFKSHLRKSISYFEQHLEIVERIADLEKQARAYCNLGSCYELLHQYAQAVFCHNKRLELVRSTSNRVAELCTLCNLGNCLRAIGKLEESLDNYSLALELCQASGNKAGEQVALLNLGTTCELIGDTEKAIEWHTLSLSLSVEADDLQGQARAFGTLADLYRHTGQLIKAHEYYKQLVHVFERIGDRDARSTAAQCMLQTRESLERQQRILKRQSRRRRRNKRKEKGRRQGSRHGSLDNLLVSDSPMVRSKEKKRRGRGRGKTQDTSWSPGLKRWYGAQYTNSTWRSGLILENRHAQEPVLTARRNLYRTSGISEQLNEHGGNLDSVLRAVRPSFYTFGEFMMGADMLHSDTECGGSVTEYEEVEDERQDPFQSRQQALLFGSARHIKDLRQVGQTLLSKSVSDPGADGAQEEWAEWLRSHGMDRDGEDNEDPAPPTLPPRAEPLDEEPQPQTQESGTRTEPQLSPKHRKRSFQGLSIFNQGSQSQEHLLEETHPAASTTTRAEVHESRLI